MERKPPSPHLRFEVFKRDGFTCQYCGARGPEAVLVIDHRDPVTNGGATRIDNLVTACLPCNAGKAGTPLDMPSPSIAIRETPRRVPMAPAEFTAARAALGFSMRGIAQVLDVEHSTISRWESGKSPIPQHIELALATLRRRTTMANHTTSTCPHEWEGNAIRVEIETDNGSLYGWMLTEAIEGYTHAGQVWLDDADESQVPFGSIYAYPFSEEAQERIAAALS